MDAIISISSLLPAPLGPAEWVGVGVLILGVASLWSVLRTPKIPEYAGKARRFGIAALALMILAIWIGGVLQIEILGAVVLACACALSVWSVLLSLGFTWRSHLRPLITPLLWGLVVVRVGWAAPRATFVLVVLIGLWMLLKRRSIFLKVDRDIHGLLTRALAIQHADAATYLVRSWFCRYEIEATSLDLLALAVRSKETMTVLPSGSTIATVIQSLEAVHTNATRVLDERLSTDNSADRTSSWIRVLSGMLVRRLLARSGIAPTVRFLSNLILATPLKNEKRAGGSDQEISTQPDAEEYVAGLLSRFPAAPNKSDLERMIEAVKRESDEAGEEWLRAVASAAERRRQQSPRAKREYRTDLVAEVLWAIYESVVGPRPDRFDIFDQLRLQVPELLDGLSIQQMQVEDGPGILRMSLQGSPSSFDELSGAKYKIGAKHPITIETRDRRRWQFQQVQVGEGAVQMTFRPSE